MEGLGEPPKAAAAITQGRALHALGPARHHEEARGLPRAGPAEDVRGGTSRCWRGRCCSPPAALPAEVFLALASAASSARSALAMASRLPEAFAAASTDMAASTPRSLSPPCWPVRWKREGAARVLRKRAQRRAAGEGTGRVELVSAGEAVARRAQQRQKHHSNAGPASHTLGPARHHEAARGLPRAGPAEDVQGSGPNVGGALAALTSGGAVGLALNVDLGDGLGLGGRLVGR